MVSIKRHISRFFASKSHASVMTEISFSGLRTLHVEYEEDDLPAAAESHISSTRCSCIVAKCSLRSSTST